MHSKQHRTQKLNYTGKKEKTEQGQVGGDCAGSTALSVATVRFWQCKKTPTGVCVVILDTCSCLNYFFYFLWDNWSDKDHVMFLKLWQPKIPQCDYCYNPYLHTNPPEYNMKSHWIHRPASVMLQQKNSFSFLKFTLQYSHSMFSSFSLFFHSKNDSLFVIVYLLHSQMDGASW